MPLTVIGRCLCSHLAAFAESKKQLVVTSAVVTGDKFYVEGVNFQPPGAESLSVWPSWLELAVENTEGTGNVAMGVDALWSNTTGVNPAPVWKRFQRTPPELPIGSRLSLDEDHITRIGRGAGQLRACAPGIRGVQLGPGAAGGVIDADGQLGTPS